MKADEDSTYYGDAIRGKQYRMFEFLGQNKADDMRKYIQRDSSGAGERPSF